MADNYKDKVAKSAQNDESVPRFLRTVFQILEDQSHTEYICWSQDGRAVMIKNPTTFAQDLLPVYFKHSNYTSFVRQLNLYAFRKQKNYPYDNAFAHSMFIRGRRELLKFIKRKGYGETKQLESQIASTELSEEEPRFEEAVEQNRSFKQVNKDISDKLKSMEEQIAEMNEKNDQLQKQIHAKEQSEVFLKKLITKVSKVYGLDNIKTLMNSVKAELQPAEIKAEVDSMHIKDFGDCDFYENLFSRKISTASTQADMSDLNLYPFLDDNKAMMHDIQTGARDPLSIWQEDGNKLNFELLPKRNDSDFGIGAFSLGRTDYYYNSNKELFNFN